MMSKSEINGIHICDLLTQLSKAINACNKAAQDKRMEDNCELYAKVRDLMCNVQDFGIGTTITEAWQSGYVEVEITLIGLNI